MIYWRLWHERRIDRGLTRPMKCVICRLGDTHPGTTTITLERGAATLVFKNVPAEVCENCGEAFVDEQASANLPGVAEEAARSGVLVDIREYTAASA